MTRPKDIPRNSLAGEVGKLTKDYRVLIPLPMRRQLNWLAKDENAPALIAELWALGTIRLYQQQDVSKRLADARNEIEQSGHTSFEISILLSAFNDRFRKVRFYPAEGRVRLGDSIVAFLDPNLRIGGRVFVSSMEGGVEILSLDERVRRRGGERFDTVLEQTADEADPE